MTLKAKAAIYEAPNTPFVIKEYPLRDTGPGEVLVRVTMSTICRSDIHSYEGRRPNPCPGILGHEIVGVVHQIGPSMPTYWSIAGLPCVVFTITIHVI